MGKSKTAEQFYVAQGRDKVPTMDAEQPVTALAVLTADQQARQTIEDLHMRFAKTPKSTKVRFEDHGLSVDDFEEANEGLLKMLDVDMS